MVRFRNLLTEDKGSEYGPEWKGALPNLRAYREIGVYLEGIKSEKWGPATQNDLIVEA